MGRAPTGPGRGEVTSVGHETFGEGLMMRFGNGPRRRRMIRGTIARIGGLIMRSGLRSQLATLDCTSSRRSTVMCALPRATAVTTEYQRDSSSKRPRSSVVSAARAPTHRRLHALVAPQHVRGSNRHALSGTAELDTGLFHIRLRRSAEASREGESRTLRPSRAFSYRLSASAALS